MWFELVNHLDDKQRSEAARTLQNLCSHAGCDQYKQAQHCDPDKLVTAHLARSPMSSLYKASAHITLAAD